MHHRQRLPAIHWTNLPERVYSDEMCWRLSPLLKKMHEAIRSSSGTSQRA